MVKFEKNFFPFDADIKKKDDDKIILSVGAEEITVPKNLFPKSLDKETKIKLVLASEESYDNRLEKRAKDILNEIIG